MINMQKTQKEVKSFLLKYYLLAIFKSMYFITSFTMIIVNENIQNPTKITTLLIICSAVKVLFGIPSGAFADRFGRKNTLLLSNLCGIISLFFFLLRRDYSDFVISYITLGLWFTLEAGSIEAFIYDNMKELGIAKDYAKYNSRKCAISDIALSLSVLSTSYMVLFGYNIIIILTIFTSCICTSVIILSMKDTNRHDKNIKKLNKGYWKILKKGFIYSFKHKTILKFIIFIVFMNSFVYVLDNYYELILFHITNNLSLVPILMAIGAANASFWQVFTAGFIQKKKVIFTILIILISVTSILIGFSLYSFPVSYIFLLICWSGFQIAFNVVNAKKQIIIPSKIRATVNSVEGFLLGISGIVYLFIFGHIVELTSYRIGFMILSSATLLLAAMFLFILGFDRHLIKKENL